MKNPRLLRTTQTMLATVALTGLMAGAAARANTPTASNDGPGIKGQLAADDTDAGKHDCKGKNSCKGQGGCKTSDNGCKGKNSCKGKGGCKSSAS